MLERTCWNRTMQKTENKLTEPRAEALIYILENGGQIIGYQGLADAREKGHEATRRLCGRMEDDGLLTISSHANGSMIEFTETGRQLAIEVGYGTQDVGTGSSTDASRVVRRLHGVTAHCSIRNKGRLPDRWRRRLAERDDLNWIHVEDYDDQSDAYIAARKRWVMRFHRDSITLQMRQGDAVERFSTADAFRELTSRIRDGLRWIREMTGAQVDMKDVEITGAECAYEEHHLALLADALPGLRLEDIRVSDRETGKDVVKMDKSPGLPETETMSGERAEEIGNVIEDELRQYARHSDAVKWRHVFEREAMLQDVDPVDAVHAIREAIGDDGDDSDAAGQDDPGDDPGTGGDYYDEEMTAALERVDMW